MDACDARCRPGRARGVAVACCSTDPNFEIYNVALAGDRLAFGVRHGAGAAGACEGSKICLSPPRSVLLWSPPARLRASTGARGNRLIWRFSRGAPTFLGLVWGSTGASRMFVTARFEGCHAGTLGNLRGNLRGKRTDDFNHARQDVVVCWNCDSVYAIDRGHGPGVRVARRQADRPAAQASSPGLGQRLACREDGPWTLGFGRSWRRSRRAGLRACRRCSDPERSDPTVFGTRRSRRGVRS